MRWILLSLACLSPAPAWSIGILGFDHARPLDPARVEAGGGAAFGDSVLALTGITRFGLLPDLEIGARAALVSLSDRDDAGFEIEGTAKFRFLRQRDTADVVEVSFMGAASLFNTADVFLLGVDPTLLASHHFPIAGQREIFVAAGLGLAVTFVEADESTQTDFGLLGTLAAGVDIIPYVRLGLEARLRDDLRRVGLGVTYLF